MNQKSLVEAGPHGGLRPIWAIAVLCLAGFATEATAANHVVSSQASTFSCASVAPGDTVTLGAGARGPLSIKGCNGSSTKRIRIINDAGGDGPTIIRRTSGASGGFVLACEDCVNVDIDGSAKWRGAPAGRTYGIKVTMTGGGGPTAFIKIAGLSRFLAIRNVEIDGAWPSLADDGIGISVNDHARKAADNPGIWREGILIEDNYIHNVEGEGLYVGPNWRTGEDIPVRDAELRGNLIEDTGWDGINLKSSIAGSNSIHHNVLRRVGTRQDDTDGQHSGITIYEGNGDIYNNWIEKAGNSGILHFLANLPSSYGAQQVQIYNNVIVDPGRLRANRGNGITSSGKASAAPPRPLIYNNTIIGATAAGIRVGDNASSGFVRDNIIADSADKPISVPAKIQSLNNRAGNAGEMGFMSLADHDYRLRSDSPARDAGSVEHPDTDYLGVHRPVDGAADQGAYEFDKNGDTDARPKPPVVAVE